MSPSPRPFTKMESAGNDLVVVDARERPLADPEAFARRVCARRFGVGGDGLMLLEPSNRAAALARMFNPDGTEDFCGNGLRCVAAWLHARGEGGPLETPLALHETSVAPEGDGRYRVTVELLEPGFAPAEIPAAWKGDELTAERLDLGDAAFEISSCSVGTTHTIIFVDDLPDDASFERHSARIETHPLFPERTSVLWLRVPARDRIEMRIWERGVGETFACGTGACAAVVLATRLGKADGRAEVVTRGGRMTVEWDGHGAPRLTGPARVVYDGTLGAGD